MTSTHFWPSLALAICAIAACTTFSETAPTTKQIVAKSKADVGIALALRGTPEAVIDCIINRRTVLWGDNPCDRTIAEYAPVIPEPALPSRRKP